MQVDLQQSAKLLLELIAEQRSQEVTGHSLKADNHKLSEVALLLSQAMRVFPPSCSVPVYTTPSAANVEAPKDETMDVE
jgi:hypothetical protein